MSTTSAERIAAFLALVHEADLLRVFKSTDDDTLVTLGAGLTIEAFEGRYEAAKWQARELFGIPEDACDLVTAAYVTAVTPNLGAVILQRPNEGTIREIRVWLRAQGIDTKARTATPQ